MAKIRTEIKGFAPSGSVSDTEIRASFRVSPMCFLRRAVPTRKRPRNPVTRSEGYAERMAILEDLGVQEKALIQDDGLYEVTVADDDQAKKHFYSRAFQEWAEGSVEGTTEEIFDAVTMLLEGS